MATNTTSPGLESDLEKSSRTARSGPPSCSDSPDSCGPAPDGGREAWLVAAGGACTFFSCLGFANAFGSFAEYYLKHQLRGETPDRVAWIGSLSAFLQFFAGMVGGPLFDRYGAKVIRPAAVVYVFSIMMLSLCSEYWHFMLVQGVLMGSTMGFLQFPAMAAISQFFDKKRGAAFGLAISGSSIGGIVIPIAVSQMLNNSTLGFGWTVRIVGFLFVPFLVFATVVLKARLPPRTTSFWIMSAFADKTLMALVASLFFSFLGMFLPLFFLPTYATAIRGASPSFGGYLLAITNAASTFGRVIPGIMADKLGKINVYAAGALATGIVIFCMDFARTDAELVVYAVVFGFTSGTIISGVTVALTACAPTARDVGTYTGMAVAIGALGGLLGPPIEGAFVNRYHGFYEASMFAGAMCFFGGCIAVVTKLTTKQGLLGRV